MLAVQPFAVAQRDKEPLANEAEKMQGTLETFDLNHKVVNDAVKDKAVIKALLRQLDKVSRCLRRLICCQLDFKITHARIKNSRSRLNAE